MSASPSGISMEVFGRPFSSGPVPTAVRAWVERRIKDRFCPYLMVACPRPFPVCSVSDGREAIPICPHRLLERQAIFRVLTPFLPGPRPMVLRHMHPVPGTGVLSWVLFDARHPDRWIGVNIMAPLPESGWALAHALHDLSCHGKLREGGYALDFDWPAATAQGGRWIERQAEWAMTWRRPVYTFVPQPLKERLEAFLDVRETSPSLLHLVSASLEREGGKFSLRLSAPPSPEEAPPDHGDVWRALVRHWSDWIPLEVLQNIKRTAPSDLVA